VLIYVVKLEILLIRLTSQKVYNYFSRSIAEHLNPRLLFWPLNSNKSES